MRGTALLLMMAWAGGGGVAWADHTKEDAQATTRKLDAILHPKKPKPKVAAAKTAAPAATAKTPAATTGEVHVAAAASVAKPVVDPLFQLMVHAMSIPFDENEREAHLRDIPKNAKELDAHLRRLNAALETEHHHR